MLPYSRLCEQIGGDATSETGLDLAPLVGVWVSFDKNTPGIVRIRVSAEAGQLGVQAFGRGSPDLSNWGEVPAAAFAIDPVSKQAVAFRAHYEFGANRAMLAAYLNKRLLVVDTYKEVQDEHGHAHCFWRDHFYEEGE